jgi:hypothetical protein
MLQKKSAAGAITLIALPLLLGTLLLAAGCGKGGEGEPTDVRYVWGKAAEADKGIRSGHTEIVIYYEETKYGGGPAMSMIIDRSGDRIHERQLLFDQVVSEYILVGSTGYVKEVESNSWTTREVSSAEDPTSDYTSTFEELPDRAESYEYLGPEMLGGREADRYRFKLSPQAVNEMFPPTPPGDFSQTTGGVVDAWIEKEGHLLIRYEGVISDVLISPEIGNGNIRFVVNISKVNEPIDIEPPI